MKDRIKMVMTSVQMSQKIFAEAIGISAGTLSSILSGHTKPTLQTVVLITNRFPSIDMKWLITGEGSMNVNEMSVADATPVDTPQATMPPSGVQEMPDLFSSVYSEEKPAMQTSPKVVEVPVKRRISEIRVFFDDGTYETYGLS
ncbi:MAG: helix-turn-helix transcriptional regulator [Prevotellaceae bacterium]|nr:helix-turn-helix transcriptional regulator [Prevotellaceae bacterium]